MQALLLSVVFCVSNLDEPNKYFVFNDRIENNRKEIVVQLEKYDIYNTNFRHDSPHDDGRRLRLYSRLGYILENIPLYYNRFYNECVEIFLEIEKRIPQAYKCLKSNGQNAKEVSTLRFSFPKNPEIKEKDGSTFFGVDDAVTCTENGQYKTGYMKAVGLYERDEDIIYVTLASSHYHWVTVHEYIHSCGYTHYCDESIEYEKKIFKCAKRVK